MPHINETKRITKTSLYSWVLYKNIHLQLTVVGIILITVALRVLAPEMEKRIINEAIGLRDLPALWRYCAIYIGAVTLAGVLKFVINLMQVSIGERALLVIRNRLYEHLLSLPVQFYRRTSPGNVISYIITEFIPVATFIGQAVAMPTVNILTFLAMAAYMLHLNLTIGLIAILIYPVEILVLPRIQKYFRRASRRRIKHTQRLSGLVGEAVSGVHEVHANASIPLEKARFSKILNEMYKATVMQNGIKFAIKFVNNFFMSLGPFVLFLVGGYYAINGHLDVGSIVAFMSAFQKLYDPWKELMEFWQVYQDSSVRYKQIMRSFDHAPEFAQTVEGRAPYTLTNDVEVRELTFVVGNNIKLLDRVSLKVKGGEHIALVGFSGSGKSTLALCIAQLYRYTGGSILIGGKEVSELAKPDMSFNLGMVAQHPFIFDGTVKANLLYSCEALALQGGSCTESGEEPSLDMLVKLIQQVGLFTDILAFALRTKLDSGTHLGLRQKILQARKEFQEGKDGMFADIADYIEFFDMDSYCHYLSVAENIAFGAAVAEDYDQEHLHLRPKFIEFLEYHGLMAHLIVLGETLARLVTDELGPEPEMEAFTDCPIPITEYGEYQKLANRLDSGEPLSEEENGLILKLALGFTPGIHRQVSLDRGFANRVVNSRKDFIARVEEDTPGIFRFFEADKYIESLNIKDNILFGRVRSGDDVPDIEEEIYHRINQALIMQESLETVLEIGLEFEVGSMGDRLSGGQRQKIALARTFLKNPPILILDEATAALDNKSQTRVQNIITNNMKGKSTVLAVIHRLDMLPYYDKIVVLKDGRIVEQGPYDELVEKRGALHTLLTGNH
ncbi:ABC transporter transmembrane domain-containing protein [Pseudodesulfovibrio piezophilus]|uniref:ABC transporter related protein n=1 Tax=Pseudodesulfovibrio piezophilus (strain DSM 21447 / JCM 15486 / C1TLV30) TaxID=1322246 RepID=M1WM81_PSEP2|nr:ABC transporter transmembrane domain-containing protein [Pseudodesulfovibrio piezophilus]CCH49145.1 ABC transporter related protein [Pseudodesulfovibrio piezophilus C1TLV30]